MTYNLTCTKYRHFNAGPISQVVQRTALNVTFIGVTPGADVIGKFQSSIKL